jgi:hypothetical protein
MTNKDPQEVVAAFREAKEVEARVAKETAVKVIKAETLVMKTAEEMDKARAKVVEETRKTEMEKGHAAQDLKIAKVATKTEEVVTTKTALEEEIFKEARVAVVKEARAETLTAKATEEMVKARAKVTTETAKNLDQTTAAPQSLNRLIQTKMASFQKRSGLQT